MPATLAPVPRQQFSDAAGNPMPGALISFFASGTSVLILAWTDAAMTVALSNPAVCDSGGFLTYYLDTTLSYKIVVKNAAGVTQYTVDPVRPVPVTFSDGDIPGTAGENLTAGQVVYLSDGSGSLTVGRWYRADADNAYSSTQAPAVGMMIASLNTGVIGAIRTSGQVTGLSGLTAGVTYYISTTAGALSATAPSNARIVGVADSASTLVLSQTAGIGAALATSIGNVNLVADPTFLIWPSGDTSAPAHWTLTGTGAAVFRSGTGLGTTVRKVGDFCAGLTVGTGQANIQQTILSTAAFTRFNFLQGQNISAGAWLRTTTTSTRLFISDGVGSAVTEPVTPDATFHWVTCTLTINPAATTLIVGMLNATNGSTSFMSGPTVVLGPIPPATYQPAPQRYDTARMYLAGAQTTGTDKDRLLFERPALIKDIQLIIKTVPTGASLIVDINSWDGAAFTTMCTTKPTIAISASTGGAQPDGTYARRCMTLYSGSGAAAGGSYLSMDIDQVGSGVAGSDLWCFVRYLSFCRPLEEALAYNDIA